jgi:hypothetical protein
MKRTDIDLIVNSSDREDLLQFFKIRTFDSLLYHTPYIERIIRSSDMYTVWRRYCFVHEDASIDIIEELDTRDLQKTKVELHHCKYTLFDIVQYVGRKLLDDKEETSAFEIAELVLKEHLEGNIYYVPLLITDHQKYHSNLIEIEEDKYKGNGHIFEQRYIN